MLRVGDLENKSILITGASSGIQAGLLYFSPLMILSGYITGQNIHVSGGWEIS
jgi:hypothetical protein